MDSEYEVETITLDTKLGVISGEIVQVGDDCKVARFLGIPYAQQPIGDLRFEPLRPLEGKLDSEEGKRCPVPYRESRPNTHPKTPQYDCLK